MCSAQRNVPNHSQMCAAANSPPPLRPTGVATGHRGPRASPPWGCPWGQTRCRPDPAWLQGPACPTASGCRGLAGRGQGAGRTAGRRGVNGGVPVGQGCVPNVPVPPRPCSPRPAWGPGPVRWGHVGSRPRCPAGAQPSGTGLSDGIWVPAVTAAGGGAVPATWRLCKESAGEDRRRLGRRGHRGHRRGDTRPPPRTCGRVRGWTRTRRAAGGMAGHCPAPWARHVCAGARGRGHTCAGTGGQGPAGLPVLLPPQLPATLWVSRGVRMPADASPSHSAPAAALPAPHRAVMNGSGGSSGTHAAESVCAIDFSSTAAESGAGADAATGIPAGWHGEGSHDPTPRGHVPHATSLSPSPPHSWATLGTVPGPGTPQPCRGVPSTAGWAQMWGCPPTTHSHHLAHGGHGEGGDGRARGMRGAGTSWCPPTSPPRHCGHTRCQPLPSTHRHRVPWLRAVGLRHGHGAGAGQDVAATARGDQGPSQQHGAQPSSTHRCGDAGTRSAPRPGDGWQGHSSRLSPWCEGTGPLSPPAWRGGRDMEQSGCSLA